MFCIILYNGEEEFPALATKLKKYLQREIKQKNVLSLTTDEEVKIGKVWRILHEPKSKNPIVIFFLGHGSPDGWSKCYDYTMLTILLKKCPAQVFLVNVCCHSIFLIPALEGQEISKERVGLLSTRIPIGTTNFSSSIEEMLCSWRVGKRYDPLDHSSDLIVVCLDDNTGLAPEEEAALEKPRRGVWRFEIIRWGLDLEYLLRK